ncbi:hypothetical protein ACRALDRAFT_205398 [Sodiomyces alcalophilus JCM 7366]|uniref:uncharacterized protein n=1 Tax=Sodiomyces alcalophilus JCM 7366 TaxID=591952 RepID=UPI0039B67F11
MRVQKYMLPSLLRRISRRVAQLAWRRSYFGFMAPIFYISLSLISFFGKPRDSIQSTMRWAP